MTSSKTGSTFDLAPSFVTSFIDGGFVADTGGFRVPVHYPGDGRVVSELVEADAAEVDAAVRSARNAFDHGPWRQMSLEERQAVLYRIHDVILANADELAALECLNTGIVMREIRDRHILRAASNFKFFAEVASQYSGEVWTQNKNYLTFVTRAPVGVAALIAPWNAPLALASMKVATAIAFGNTCVLKPSEQTPLSMARMVELIAEAGAPPGVVNLVNGRGSVTGQALIEHEGVDLVAFTGGTETGRHIMRTAGSRLRPAGVELGGKSANIIFADADPERALDGALLSIFSNNGQQCLAGSRILVQDSIFDDFVGRFVERARKLKIGDPMDPTTELGPVASLPHRNRVLSYVDIATSEGGKLLTGGRALDRDGYFMEPTAVMADNRTRVCQEEIFGPFAAFVKFSNMEEAISIANDSPFGLVGYCWTRDLDTALRVSQQVRAGVMWVNTPLMRELRASFGGMKDSGIGRDGASASLNFFTEEKTTTIPVADVPLRKLGLGS